MRAESASALRPVAAGAAVAAMAIGGGHVVAWLSGAMAALPSSTIIMKANAGLALLLSGLALILLSTPLPSPARRRAARACAALVLLLGFATLTEHIARWDLHLDQLLATERLGAAATTSPNRMGPHAALSFVLLGVALLALSSERRRSLHEPPAIVVAVLALLAGVGYLYGASELYAGAYLTAIAWPTAVSLLLVAIGVLCARPDRGLMAGVTALDSGGTLVRTLLGPIVIVPLLFGWLRLAGEREGWFDAAMGTGVMMVLFIITFSSLLLFAGRRVSAAAAAVRTSEQAARESEAAARASAAELGAVLDSLQDAVFVYDAAGNAIRTNPAARELYGMDLTGERVEERARLDLRVRRLDGTEMPAPELPSRRALRGERVLQEQYLFTGTDGTDHVGEASATPLVMNGKVVGAVAIAHDITDRKRIEEALRRSEEKFAKAFKLNSAAMAITRLEDGLYLEVNDRFADVTGFSRAETVGRTTTELNIWTDPADRAALVRDIRAHGVVQNLECRFVRPDGEEWMGLVSSQVSEIQGQPVLISSFADVTEGKRAEQAMRESQEALREANVRLAEADRRKDEFLAVLSHELRNPLAPVRSALYLLDHAAPGSDQARRAATVIDRQVGQLTRLVDDLLDVTRITRGKIHLHRETVELNGLVHRTVEDHREIFSARDVELCVEVAAADLWVDADAHRLAQVVGNLLHNAAKFTRPGGRTVVSVATGDDPPEAVITVADNGIGIEADAVGQLFEPFMQVDAGIDRAAGGLGLGLSLVKSLTEMHGGSVSVRSDGIGHGAEFTVRLPLVTAPAVAHSPGTGGNNRRRRIFVVEDNVDAAEMLRDALRLAGHDVGVAFNGADALDAIREFRPEIVLCDIGLPGMSGYDLARALRADRATASAYLIALTGYALPEDIAKAREAGFDLHMAKQPDSAKLRDAIALAPHVGRS